VTRKLLDRSGISIDDFDAIGAARRSPPSLMSQGSCHGDLSVQSRGGAIALGHPLVRRVCES
jgi:acetyl-CoA acetyltransferase